MHAHIEREVPRSVGTSTIRQFIALLIVSSCYALAFTDRQILNLMVEPMKADLGITDSEVGFLLGPAFSLSYTAVGLIAGYLADHFSRRNLLLAAGLVWSMATIASGFAQDYQGLVMARAVVGASEAFLFPAGMSMISEMFDRRRLPVATTVFLICPYVGGGLAMMGGGLIIGATAGQDSVHLLLASVHGWQVALVVMGAIGILPVLSLLLLKEPVRGQQSGGHDRSRAYGFLEGTAYLLRSWRFYFMFFFGIAFICLMLHGIPAWSPTIFVREHGMEPHQIGMIYGIQVLLCGIVGGLCSPPVERWLARRYADSTYRIVLAGPLIMAGFAFVLLASDGFAPAYVSIAIMSFGYCFAMPMAGVSLQLATPARLRGQAASFYFVIINLFGLGLGPLLVPWTAKYLLGDPNMLSRALAIDVILTGAIAFALLMSARRHFLRALA